MGSWAGDEEGEELTIISKYNKQKHSDIKHCMTATTTASCMFAVLLFYSYFVFPFFDNSTHDIAESQREREMEQHMKRFSYWEPIVMHRFTYTESGKESQTKAQANRWIDKRHSQQQQHHHHQQHHEHQHRHQHHYHEHPLHLNQLNSAAAVCESTHTRFRVHIRICIHIRIRICIHIRIRFRYRFPCCCCS